MDIKYITNVRIPTSRAQGYAIMKMCEQFANAGATVDLIIPNKRNNESEQDPFIYYNARKNFSIRKVWSTDFLGTRESYNRIFYWVDMLSFIFSLILSDVLRKGDIIYTRDFMVALFVPSKYSVYLELHEIPRTSFLFKKVVRKVNQIFVLNDNLKKILIEFGVKPDVIFITPSGVEIEDFTVQTTQAEARKKLDIPIESKIVVYTGHLYEWKGVYTLGDVAQLLPDILFFFIGGTDPDLSLFRNKYKKYNNIVVIPFQPREMIPMYMKMADVLVVPNSGKTAISAMYTSPLKLFEYMASERPIVVSDLPSIRSVVDESVCFFAEADNPKSFADVIEKVIQDKVKTECVTKKAFKDVQQYSWTKRAQNIIHIIQNA